MDGEYQVGDLLDGARATACPGRAGGVTGENKRNSPFRTRRTVTTRSLGGGGGGGCLIRDGGGRFPGTAAADGSPVRARRG